MIMTTRRKAAQRAVPTPSNAPDKVVIAKADASKSDAQSIADFALGPSAPSAVSARCFATNFAEVGLTEAIATVCEMSSKVKSGDLSELELMLASQAIALNAIFNSMAQRAARNAGEYLGATETYLRLALKAQGQCRATVETLANIKNPRPLAFVRQANITSGAQQINNGIATDSQGVAYREEGLAPSRARVENPESTRSKLLESDHGKRLDISPTQATSGIDPVLATLGKVDGADDQLG